jgi:hypothetical protein
MGTSQLLTRRDAEIIHRKFGYAIPGMSPDLLEPQKVPPGTLKPLS